ncbi:MAG: arginine--tRNA ligase [Termitinemataceae bacterium]
MQDIKYFWKQEIAQALNKYAQEQGIEETFTSDGVVVEVPPKPELGDFGIPLFPFAKVLKKGPPQIAQALVAILEAQPQARAWGSFTAEGPYINIRLEKAPIAGKILQEVQDQGAFYGKPGTLKNSRIMVEFSSPNTNKPLHLGHLRNDVLGESIARILTACGAEIRKVCIINDRGVHICKSMLAYKERGQGATPESFGVKSDRFVGDWYVEFHKMSQEDPTAEERAQELLRKWELGDPETVSLWKQMNQWAVDGIKKTYERTGVSFDHYYFESQTYLKGKEEVLKGLERGIFYREEDGSVWIDLTEEGLDKKVLLRKDGTSLYITQDIGTAIYRHHDWPFQRLVYVVGSEQQYHFKVLFKVLEKLGYDWAKNLYHLSYGMVNLPEGKMKSREGTVVDADDLIDSLKEMALQEIREKNREEAVGDGEAVAERIAVGALHYYLLQVSPTKDMLFNPKESLSFNGNTGPYLQYMGARISSMLRKKSGSLAAQGQVRPELLTGEAEWTLLKTIAAYPDTVALAASQMDPSIIAGYLYELSKDFSRFYHDCPILNAQTPDLAASRLALSQAVLQVLQSAMQLVCIPFLDVM